MPLGVESELAITAFEEVKDCWLAMLQRPYCRIESVGCIGYVSRDQGMEETPDSSGRIEYFRHE